MKHFIFVCMLAFSVIGVSQTVITSLPDGSFLGSGVWYNNINQAGPFEQFFTITDNSLRVDTAGGETAVTLNLAFAFTDTGAITISYEGAPVGSGQCNTVSCNFSFKISNVLYVNTMYLLPGVILNIGYYVKGTQRLYWQSQLQQVQ